MVWGAAVGERICFFQSKHKEGLLSEKDVWRTGKSIKQCRDTFHKFSEFRPLLVSGQTTGTSWGFVHIKWALSRWSPLAGLWRTSLIVTGTSLNWSSKEVKTCLCKWTLEPKMNHRVELKWQRATNLLKLDWTVICHLETNKEFSKSPLDCYWMHLRPNESRDLSCISPCSLVLSSTAPCFQGYKCPTWCQD